MNDHMLADYLTTCFLMVLGIILMHRKTRNNTQKIKNLNMTFEDDIKIMDKQLLDIGKDIERTLNSL